MLHVLGRQRISVGRGTVPHWLHTHYQRGPVGTFNLATAVQVALKRQCCVHTFPYHWDQDTGLKLKGHSTPSVVLIRALLGLLRPDLYM